MSKKKAEEVFSLQEELIRGFGREVCHTVKFWKPVNRLLATCVLCGEKVLSIHTHMTQRHKSNE